MGSYIRRKYTKEQKLFWAKQYIDSGETLSEFCEGKNFSYQCLKDWVKLYKQVKDTWTASTVIPEDDPYVENELTKVNGQIEEVALVLDISKIKLTIGQVSMLFDKSCLKEVLEALRND